MCIFTLWLANLRLGFLQQAHRHASQVGCWPAGRQAEKNVAWYSHIAQVKAKMSLWQGGIINFAQFCDWCYTKGENSPFYSIYSPILQTAQWKFFYRRNLYSFLWRNMESTNHHKNLYIIYIYIYTHRKLGHQWIGRARACSISHFTK